MRGGCVKKRQYINVKFLATVQHCFVKTMARKKIQGQLESRMVYVKTCIFRHSPLKPVLKKMAEALHNGQ